MRYRLRTLLILLALGPPVLGFAALLSPEYPVLALSAIVWALALFTSVTWGRKLRPFMGLTAAEWLVIIAIVALAIPSSFDTRPVWPYRE